MVPPHPFVGRLPLLIRSTGCPKAQMPGIAWGELGTDANGDGIIFSRTLPRCACLHFRMMSGRSILEYRESPSRFSLRRRTHGMKVSAVKTSLFMQRARSGRLAAGRSFLVRYSMTLVGVGMIAAIVGGVNHDWGGSRVMTIENPGTPFVIAVVGAAVAFGVGPAFAAMIASFLLIGLFFSGQEDPQELVILFVTMLLVVMLAELQYRARVRAERVQARLRAILESMSDSVIFMDAMGRPEDLNSAAQALLGASDRGAALAAITPPPNVASAAGMAPPVNEHTLLTRALAGETDACDELTIAHPDGTYRTLNVAANPVYDAAGQIIGAVSVSRDVTEAVAATAERERLMTQVQEQAAYLAASFAAAVDGIAVYDTRGNTIRRNDANYRMFGLDPGQDWSRLDIVRQVHMRHPDGRPIPDEELHTSRALRGETVNGEVLLITDGAGHDHYLRQNAAPIRGEDGAILGAVLVTNDITSERTRTEEREALLALMEERRRFAQTVFDSVPVGLAVLDAHTLQYQAVNPAYVRAVPQAYRGRDFFGLALPDVFPGVRDTDFVAHVREVAATGIAYSDQALAFAHPERGTVYWDEMVVPLSTETPDRRFVLLQQTDVTEQMAARQRIAALAAITAERAEQFETVFASLAEGLLLVTPAGTITRWNVAAEDILALGDEILTTITAFGTRFDLRGEDGAWLAPEHQITPDTRRDHNVRSTFVRQFRNGRGERRWMQLSAVPIQDAQGMTTGTVIAFVDITREREEAEERARLLRELTGREEFTRAIFASVPEGLMVMGVRDGTVRMANAAFARFVGENVTPESLTGQQAVTVLPGGGVDAPPMIATWYRTELPRIAETRKAAMMREVAFPHPTRGETFWDIAWVPLAEGDETVRDVLTVVIDVTEQTRNRHYMEELASAAAQRAAELEAVISSMPDGVAILTLDGAVLQVNMAARRILAVDVPMGQSPSEQVTYYGTRYLDGTPTPPEDTPAGRAARGENFSDAEYLITGGQGETFISCSGAPIRDAAGMVTGAVVIFSDITARKHTEGLMTRLGRIVDASSNEVYVLDAHTFQIIQANEGVRRNLGYTLSEITTHTLLDIAPGLSEDILETLVTPLRTGEEPEITYELQFARANGTTYPVEMQLSLSHAEIPAVFVAVVQDITERHEAVRQREAMFREIDERRRFAQTVIEIAPAGIAVFTADDDFTVRTANEQYTQLLDEPLHDHGIVGREARVFIPAAEASGVLTIFRQVRDSGEPVFLREFEYAGFAHGQAYFDWSLVPLREDGVRITGLLLLVNDVTERVRSRQRIEELAWDAAQRANELETMLASITDGVIVVDATGRVTLENAASHRLLGPERVASLVVGGERGEHQQSIFADSMPLARAMRGETVADQVLLVCKADGETARYLLCSSAPVRGVDGIITGAVAVSRDITAIKQVEQLKDEFVSVAAHELRTPLTAIKGYTELLERRLGRDEGRDEGRARERQSLAVIRRQTERLARLVNEMLDVSRIEAGQLQLNRESFDLSALAEETMNSVRISDDVHAFVLDAPSGVEAFADTARIEQVLINLITNAATYSPQGGTITVHVRAESDHATVSVRDEGIGIAPEEVSHLFARFYRSPQAGAMRSGGMGLGLYISREIIQRHGGTITVESTPGVGSTFTFTLPRPAA